jgi:hypothetical protein
MTTKPAAGKFELDDFVAAAMSEFAAKGEHIKTTDSPTIKTATAAAAVVEHATPAAFEVKLRKGEVEYSKLFGSVPKNMTDFAVRKFTDVPSNFTHLIPKMDTKYVVQTEEAARLVAALMDGDKVLRRKDVKDRNDHNWTDAWWGWHTYELLKHYHPEI